MITDIPGNLSPAFDMSLDCQRETLDQLMKDHPDLADTIRDKPAFYCVRSHSRVDVGSWLMKVRIWVIALSDELVLFAPGKKPFCQIIKYDQLKDTIYNHVTGCLALSPCNGSTNRPLRMSPVLGYQILSHIHQD